MFSNRNLIQCKPNQNYSKKCDRFRIHYGKKIISLETSYAGGRTQRDGISSLYTVTWDPRTQHSNYKQHPLPIKIRKQKNKIKQKRLKHICNICRNLGAWRERGAEKK